MKYGSSIRSLKDVTDMIFDTLVKNTQYPQFPTKKLTEQFTNSEDGYINIRLGENTYHIQITKD